MQTPSLSLVIEAVEILGQDGAREGDIEARMLALADGDEMLARRLIDCLREAFGLVVVSHVRGADQMTMPDSFKAQDAQGEWREFPMSAEPIMAMGARIASHVYHEGPRALLRNIADCSAMLNTVNNALNAGGTLEGSTLNGPEFLGIPADLYAGSSPGSTQTSS